MRRTALVVPTLAVAGLALLAGCSSGGGDSCLNGSWEPVSMTEDRESLEELGATAEYTLKFDGDTISINYTFTMPKSEFSDETKSESTVTGKYSVSGDKLKLSDLKSSAKVNGEEQESADMAGLDKGDVAYSCSGDKLTIDGDDYTKK